MNRQHIQSLLILVAYALILSISVTAYSNINFIDLSDFPGNAPGYYNDLRIGEVVNRILNYLEGSLGALIMVSAGLLAILSAAFGNYRASIALLVVAIGPFILRSFVGSFFNDENIR